MNRGYPTNETYTNGNPDTLKILPQVQQELRKAQEELHDKPSLEAGANVRFLEAVYNRFAARARARKQS